LFGGTFLHTYKLDIAYNKDMKKTITIIISIILGVIIIIAILGIIKFNFIKNDIVIVPQEIPVKKEPIQMCFYQETKTPRGLYDISWVKMSILGNNVSGEFRYLPAEKDSKIGTFEGTVGEVDKQSMSRTAIVWWDTLAEGIKNREQLQIKFGEGTAVAGFGEMIQQSEGVYIYKDIDTLTYGQNMTDISCDELNERILVEKYIKENIQTLSPEKPILGGSWYTTSIHLDTTRKTGIMKYEDGHIQGSALFSYIVKDEGVVIMDIKKGDETSLTTTYIGSQNLWPPKVTITKGTFVCKETPVTEQNKINPKGTTVKKIISGREYCITTASEGAAGSTFTTYSYIAKIEQKFAKVSFILRAIECMNYDDPKQTECLKERESFNPDTLVDNLIIKAINK